MRLKKSEDYIEEYYLDTRSRLMDLVCILRFEGKEELASKVNALAEEFREISVIITDIALEED